jgi:uncharacterized protein
LDCHPNIVVFVAGTERNEFRSTMSMLRIFTPHYRIHSVCELTPERLGLWDLRGLLLDVDCTLTRYHRREPLPEVSVWLEQIRRAGFRLCLISNGLGPRIEQFAERLGLPCVVRALKPLPRGVWEALKKIDCPAAQTAIVGDQVFADVMAGRIAGIRSILVDPIHPEEEPWWTRMKRLPERVVLSTLRPEPTTAGSPATRLADTSCHGKP